VLYVYAITDAGAALDGATGLGGEDAGSSPREVSRPR
jgi:hypothetical protein